MPVALPFDEDWRVTHYLLKARPEGDCLCLGTGRYYPTWHRPGRGTERIAQLVCRRTHGARPGQRHVVMHSCDNKACIIPEHVSWGTQSQNLKDAFAKGRMPTAFAARAQ